MVLLLFVKIFSVCVCVCVCVTNTTKNYKKD